MKLENLGILDIEWLDAEIERCKRHLLESPNNRYIVDKLRLFLAVKRKLSPAKKLAEMAFDVGEKYGYELSSLQMRMIPIEQSENMNKQDFLNSEISI